MQIVYNIIIPIKNLVTSVNLKKFAIHVVISYAVVFGLLVFCFQFFSD